MEEATEHGAATPLLDAEGLKKQYTEDGSLDIHGRPALRLKTGNWRAAAIILVVECLGSLAYYGVSINLVMYLSKIFHEGNAPAAASVSTWIGTGYITPVLAAILADSYWGRYRTMLVSFTIFLVGMVVITLSAALSPSSEGTSGHLLIDQKMGFFFGLYFVAFGSGGIWSSLVPLGGDQFEDGNPMEQEKRESFFSWFYFCHNIGSLGSSTLVVWMQENINWGFGYGVTTLCLALALGTFLSGRSVYRVQRPNGSPLKKILQVLVACLRKKSLRVPTNSCKLYEVPETSAATVTTTKLEHTDELRFLDEAATISELDVENGNSVDPWKFCAVTQVELKILIRLLPIWVCSVVYSTAYAQANTIFIEQGNAMNTKIGTFSVPAASLFAFQKLSVMVWIFIYGRVIPTLGRRFISGGLGLSQLQKMGIGQFLMILVMSIAAMVELKRLENVRSGNSMSIAWQLPQYFILGASEVFNFVGLMEFFYEQAPESMRSMCTAFRLLSFSAGNYLNSFLIALATRLTGWIPDNLNDGHLDYFFWAMAGLTTSNFVLHLACAKNYKLKNVILDD